jgi:TonB family protein
MRFAVRWVHLPPGKTPWTILSGPLHNYPASYLPWYPHFRFITTVTFTLTLTYLKMKKTEGGFMRQRIRSVAFLVCTCFLLSSAAFLSAQQEAAENHRKMTGKIIPNYPPLAHDMNLGGTVKIEAVVAPNGSVKSVSVLGGHPVLAQSAMDAVRRSKWEPAAHETKELVILNFHP